MIQTVTMAGVMNNDETNERTHLLVNYESLTSTLNVSDLGKKLILRMNILNVACG